MKYLPMTEVVRSDEECHKTPRKKTTLGGTGPRHTQYQNRARGRRWRAEELMAVVKGR